MRNLMLSIMVGVIVLLLSGCANSTPKSPEKVDLGLKKENMKIYVDNTLDKDKQKRVRDAFVYSLKKMIKNNQFKLVKTKGYIGALDWNTIIPRENKKIFYKNKNFHGKYDQNVHTYEFDYFHYIDLYNFVFDKKHKLSGDYFDSVNYYKTKTDYTIKKIGNTAFEVIGFKSLKEAIDIYLQILRDSKENETFGHSDFKSYIRKYLKEKTDVGIDWTANLYYKNVIIYDARELAVNKRLILKPTILQASKKYQLKQLLKQKHYTVVDDPKEANVIISVQNLAFGSIRSISADSKIITNRIKDMRIIDPNQAGFEYTQAGVSFASMNTPASNTMAGVSSALSLVSLFDTSEYDITSVDYINIFINGKNILNKIITPKLFNIKGKANKFRIGMRMQVSVLNYATAMEIEKLL